MHVLIDDKEQNVTTLNLTCQNKLSDYQFGTH